MEIEEKRIKLEDERERQKNSMMMDLFSRLIQFAPPPVASQVVPAMTNPMAPPALILPPNSAPQFMPYSQLSSSYGGQYAQSAPPGLQLAPTNMCQTQDVNTITDLG